MSEKANSMQFWEMGYKRPGDRQMSERVCQLGLLIYDNADDAREANRRSEEVWHKVFEAMEIDR